MWRHCDALEKNIFWEACPKLPILFVDSLQSDIKQTVLWHADENVNRVAALHCPAHPTI